MTMYVGAVSRLNQLQYMCDEVGLDYPTIKFQISKNATRVSAEHGILYSAMCLNFLVQVLRSVNHPTWEITRYDWLDISEFEATLDVKQFTTNLSQTEKTHNGGILIVTKAISLANMRKNTINVVSLPEVTKN